MQVWWLGQHNSGVNFGISCHLLVPDATISMIRVMWIYVTNNNQREREREYEEG